MAANFNLTRDEALEMLSQLADVLDSEAHYFTHDGVEYHSGDFVDAAVDVLRPKNRQK